MAIHVNIGLHDWEKAIKRLVMLEIEVNSMTSLEGSTYFSDNFTPPSGCYELMSECYAYKDHIIDVSILKKSVLRYCEGKSFDYIENLVFSLKKFLTQEMLIPTCRIKAEKVPFLIGNSYSCEA